MSGDKSFELRVLEDKYREEVAALKKKLQWFAENQELLDRDAGRLKAATTEIHQLKEQVVCCVYHVFTTLYSPPHLMFVFWGFFCSDHLLDSDHVAQLKASWSPSQSTQTCLTAMLHLS